jgi:hypothetical protein
VLAAPVRVAVVVSAGGEFLRPKFCATKQHLIIAMGSPEPERRAVPAGGLESIAAPASVVVVTLAAGQTAPKWRAHQAGRPA